MVRPRVAKTIKSANLWGYFNRLGEVYPLEFRGECLSHWPSWLPRDRVCSPAEKPAYTQPDTSELVDIVTSGTATSVLRVSSPRLERRLVIGPLAPK